MFEMGAADPALIFCKNEFEFRMRRQDETA